MIKRDYIMRMIDQLVKAIIGLLFKKDARDHKGASEDASTAFNSLVGLDYILAENMSVEDIIKLLELQNEAVFSAKLIAAGKLFKEKAEADFQLDKNAEKREAKLYKALNLLAEGFIRSYDIGLYSMFKDDVEELAEHSGSTNMDITTLYRMFRYYEVTGSYAKAEDELFRLKDAGYPGIKKEGERFFKVLINKSEEELSRGNLTRSEIDTDLEDFRK